MPYRNSIGIDQEILHSHGFAAVNVKQVKKCDPLISAMH